MRKSLLTGGPVSPRSPFFPFLPRLPGGPGGPTYREQREEEEEKKKKTQIITLSLIIYNFFFLVVFVYASLGRTINARITKSSQKRFESDTGCPHTGLHNWLQFCRIFVSAGYFSNEQMAGRSKKKQRVLTALNDSTLSSFAQRAIIFFSIFFLAVAFAEQSQVGETTVEDKIQITHNLNKNVVCTHICLLEESWIVRRFFFFFFFSVVSFHFVWMSAWFRWRRENDDEDIDDVVVLEFVEAAVWYTHIYWLAWVV